MRKWSWPATSDFRRLSVDQVEAVLLRREDGDGWEWNEIERGDSGWVTVKAC